MSTTHDHTEALAQADTDPTGTTTTRRRYAQRLRGAFARIAAAARIGIVERDVFGLTESLATPPRPFHFTRDDQQVDAFQQWLRQQERDEVFDVIDRDGNQFIQAAYDKGLRDSTRRLREAGVDVPIEGIESSFNLPVHQDSLQLLYTRNFRELKGITDAMNQQISRELADGFAAGENPRKMARRVSDRVDAVGKTRATTLARTETINAHSEATLNRYERFADDIDGVTVKAEWQTAGDDRVCDICQALEGRTFTIEEARSETATIDGSQYPVRPPAHPNCRCAILPVT